MEVSKYFSLGKSSFAKQNIIALNAWLGYSPSWEVIYDEAGNNQVINNAPFLEGATLGGMYRLRGFRCGFKRFCMLKEEEFHLPSSRYIIF
ncbi:hypothetical protein A9Q75_11795 [Colwellia psychrerythraea]|uniref:Uncharacterized protein n=1 Tax=Colwellia psychrerythraea TaxID=28229 RepID=A0A1Y5EAW6_COLPS|nr:hypothetical protein A9Q75_11795 [Colwellia psychrerythraea]